jgi:hypothetical protein
MLITSTLIPCRHIAAVFGHPECERQLDDEVNLHPRWRIRNHPLYDTALQKLLPAASQKPTLVDEVLPQPTIADTTTDTTAVALVAFHALKPPRKEDERYMWLQAAGKKMFEIGCTSEYLAKVSMTLLTDAISNLERHLEGEAKRRNTAIAPNIDLEIASQGPLRAPLAVIPQGRCENNRSLLPGALAQRSGAKTAKLCSELQFVHSNDWPGWPGFGVCPSVSAYIY